MVVELVIVIGVRFPGGAAEARCQAHHLLIGMPEKLREHQGLVVEPRRHQVPGHFADEAHDVDINTGPAVNRAADQALIDFLLGCPDIGYFGVGCCADLKYRIWLLDTR